jgi:uncharacterized protein (TIGR00369 family)
MEGKPASASAMTMAQLMLPSDANPLGNVHGGVIMKLIDTAGAVVAQRHCRSICVTAGVDRLDLLRPVFVGELVIVKASLNYVGKTSMEVGVRVECENIYTGEVRHAVSAYLTFVRLDDKRNLVTAPPLLISNDDECRRWREAEARRAMREEERKREDRNPLGC